jgi:hypothetical protein
VSRNVSTNDANWEAIRDLEKDLLRQKAQLLEMEQSLPKQNGLYLKIILGNVNVSILNKNDKYVYSTDTDIITCNVVEKYRHVLISFYSYYRLKWNYMVLWISYKKQLLIHT